jgi:sulfur relay (sulfurtransferase) DsrF/TusC family protein
MEDSKYRMHGTFENRSIDLISGYIQNILNENSIQYQKLKNYKRKIKPVDKYDICYISEKSGLEIGLSKGTSNKKATFISIRYLETTDKSIIIKLKEEIERWSNE